MRRKKAPEGRTAELYANGPALVPTGDSPKFNLDGRGTRHPGQRPDNIGLLGI